MHTYNGMLYTPYHLHTNGVFPYRYVMHTLFSLALA